MDITELVNIRLWTLVHFGRECISWPVSRAGSANSIVGQSMTDNNESVLPGIIIRPRISFGNPLKKYNKLSTDDRAYVNTLMAISLTIIVILFAITYYNKEGEKYFVLGSSILMSFIVGASFTIFDRIGVAAPLEEKLSNTLHMMQAQSQEFKAIVDQQPDYPSYIAARQKFGLVGVKGDIDKRTKPPQVKRGSDAFILSVIDAAPSGSTIRYMNTYMEDESRYRFAIEEAAKRGVDLKIMLVYPDIQNSAAFIARYEDCLKDIFHGDRIEEVIHLVRGMMHPLDCVPRKIRSLRSTDSNIGSVEIRYYSRSLNFPMLIVTNPLPHHRTVLEGDVAYTGFYTKFSSEAMPYLEWRDGEFRMIEKFSALFDHKWEQYADATYIFRENNPDPAAQSGGA